jgi:putative flippase GtrA
MSLTEPVLAVLPRPVRALLRQRHEEVKFILVGGTCYLITVAINYALKLTILGSKPVTALLIATVIAAVISYILNREWSFRTRGGRRRHHEASLFFLFSAVAVALTAAPLWTSRYVLELRAPFVTRPTQEIADFVSGLFLGTLLGMVFRLWAFRRWVFPEANARPKTGLGVDDRAGDGVGDRPGVAGEPGVCAAVTEPPASGGVAEFTGEPPTVGHPTVGQAPVEPTGGEIDAGAGKLA